MAEISPRVLDQLAGNYQQALARIQVAAEAAAAALWLSFDTFSGEDEEAWSEALWPVVLGAATAVAATTRTYLQTLEAYTGIALPFPTPDSSWVREDFDGWALSPMVRARTLVAGGDAPAAAVAGAADSIGTLISSVTREAEQRAIADILSSDAWQVSWTFVDEGDTPLFPDSPEELDAAVTRQLSAGRQMVQNGETQVYYKRIPQAGACGFCIVAADQRYTSRAVDRHPLGQFHAFCRCSWRKLTPSEAESHERQLAGGKWKEVIDQRADVPA